MKFIDYGYEKKVDVDDLIDVEQTSLAVMPPQAVRAKFACQKSLSPSTISRIREEISGQEVLIRIFQTPFHSLPSVDFIKRSNKNGSFYSYNNEVEVNEDLQK